MRYITAKCVASRSQPAVEQGAAILNYVTVTGLIKNNDGFVAGVTINDVESNNTYNIKARTGINTTGVFTDSIRQMDETNAKPIVSPSQGVHIVLDKEFLPGDNAIMVPHTDDGRVLFAIPWHDRIIVGTTDTLVKEISLEPVPFKEEIEFLLLHAAR